MAASDTPTTNFRAPLENINAAMGTYLAGLAKIQGKSSETQVHLGHSALGAMKAVVDMLVAGNLVTRAAAEAEMVAFDIASGAVGADAPFIGSTVQSLEDRMSLSGDARKGLEDAFKAFLAALDAEAAVATKAKSALKPEKGDKGSADKGDKTKK